MNVMKPKITRIEEIPSSFRGRYSSEPLEDYRFDSEFDGLSHVFYWYGAGHYCGAGHIIAMSSDGLWYRHNCSHCSCYGPTDKFYRATPYASLEALEKSCDASLLIEVAPLVSAAREEGLK